MDVHRLSGAQEAKALERETGKVGSATDGGPVGAVQWTSGRANDRHTVPHSSPCLAKHESHNTCCNNEKIKLVFGVPALVKQTTLSQEATMVFEMLVSPVADQVVGSVVEIVRRW